VSEKLPVVPNTLVMRLNLAGRAYKVGFAEGVLMVHEWHTGAAVFQTETRYSDSEIPQLALRGVRGALIVAHPMHPPYRLVPVSHRSWVFERLEIAPARRHLKPGAQEEIR
jgi:hypothetical protein